MDFKQQVMRDAEAKYREMANGTAGKPLSRTPVLNSDEAYAEKRSSYCNRLIHERDSFNDAVKRTRQANKSRLEDERRQQLARAEKREAHREWRKKFFRSLIKLAVVFGALGVIVSVFIPLLFLALRPVAINVTLISSFMFSSTAVPTIMFAS